MVALLGRKQEILFLRLHLEEIIELIFPRPS